MEIRNRIFGLLTATGLSLSLFAGAVAQESADGSVTLLPADCSVEVVGGQDFNFGSWEWNGVDDYEPPAGDNGSRDVTMQVQVPGPGETCNIAVSTEGLEHTGEDVDDLIPPGRFGINVDGDGGASGAFGAGSYTVTATLNSVPDTLVAGEYQGVFTFTVTEDTPE